ncbi:MAG: hypothetical protein ACI9P5_003460 [Saprospiraceae bacterium]|jgi:hypothetical protein|tara:strand:+ start:932 stop:1129 length:198 start_codon:yes stop_codon:yes gene_type:complete
MKYVTKFLCAIAITAFFSSCASSGSGCYDFGDNSKLDKAATWDNIEIVAVKKRDNCEEAPTICGE